MKNIINFILFALVIIGLPTLVTAISNYLAEIITIKTIFILGIIAFIYFTIKSR